MLRMTELAALAGVSAGIAITGLYIGHSGAALIGLCLLLGIFIKGLDQLIDLGVFDDHRKVGFTLALAIAAIVFYLAMEHDPVFGMVVGTALGLLLAGKIDHPALLTAMIVSVVLLVLGVAFLRPDTPMSSYLLIPMAAAGNLADEWTHDRFEKGESRALARFFHHRPVLKCVALLAVVVHFAEWIHLVGFLCFDLAYDLVAVLWTGAEGKANAGENEGVSSAE